MGCVVNGPGEAREADVGIAGGDGVGMLFANAAPWKKLTTRNFLYFNAAKKNCKTSNYL